MGAGVCLDVVLLGRRPRLYCTNTTRVLTNSDRSHYFGEPLPPKRDIFL